MSPEEFAEALQAQIHLCEDVLIDKAREYAAEDRLHNFKMAASLQGLTPIQALGGMMAKHTVSIYDMLKEDEYYSRDKWAEKITDHLNYLFLLNALLVEQDNSLPTHMSQSPIDIFLDSIEEPNA